MLKSFVILLYAFSACIASLHLGEKGSCYNFNFYLSFNLQKDGFQRDIHYEVEYPTQLHNVHNDEHPEGWHVAIMHEMPNGLYANPDEIKNLASFEMVNASVMGHVNVEMQASYDTDGLGGTVLMYSIIDNFKARMWCPIHARYHPPQPNGGFAMVKIIPGTLLMRFDSHAIMSPIPCGKKVKLPCNSTSNILCDWWNTPYILLTDDIEWAVPVGNLSHYPIVCGVTLFMTLAGCLYIASSVFSTAQKQHRDRKLKLSGMNK